MSEIGLNYFYNGEPLEPPEPEEGEEICIKYKFDNIRGIMCVYHIHKYNNGNESRIYKGEIAIDKMTDKQTEDIWNSGNASEFTECL